MMLLLLLCVGALIALPGGISPARAATPGWHRCDWHSVRGLTCARGEKLLTKAFAGSMPDQCFTDGQLTRDVCRWTVRFAGQRWRCRSTVKSQDGSVTEQRCDRGRRAAKQLQIG